MERYPNIGDHGLIGDLQTAALVSTDGTVDWLCCPRFDSPSVFASILDADKGGYLRLSPDRDDYASRQLYLPETAVLITRFLTADGVGEIHDFMPVAGRQATDRHRLVRHVRVVRGTMRFILDAQPRFDYARAGHQVSITPDGATFTPNGDVAQPGLTLHLADRGNSAGAGPQRAGDGVTAAITLHAGQSWGIVLESGSEQPRRLHNDDITRLLRETIGFWRGWLAKSAYRGRWREMVSRSAMTLKLMQYAPSGALIAAPTAALPGQASAGRNWDYRYTWVRDGSLSVCALLSLGFTEEATAFANWLRERASEPGPLKIMYRVDGSSDLSEEILDHLAGWRGSRPVRIGNGAAGQLPLDIHGEALDVITLASQDGVELTRQDWREIADCCDPGASPDGPAGDEGTFPLCTFWYVEALARSGRLDEARLTFEKMRTYATHLGLYSEEISATGEQLGNFPQAFSHLALITAAVNLDYQLDHGPGMLPTATGAFPMQSV